MQAKPIPRSWINTVVSILATNDCQKILWSATAQETWDAFGLQQNAHHLLIETLKDSDILGHQPVGMRDRADGSYSDCWAFLCPHPWDSPVPLYAKIGIHHSRIHISLFSLHVDDGSEKLQKAIATYRKKHTK